MNSVWARLPYCLLKGTVRRRFLDTYLTRFFGFRIFGNRLVVSVIFFFENVQNLFQISKM